MDRHQKFKAAVPTEYQCRGLSYGNRDSKLSLVNQAREPRYAEIEVVTDVRAKADVMNVLRTANFDRRRYQNVNGNDDEKRVDNVTLYSPALRCS